MIHHLLDGFQAKQELLSRGRLTMNATGIVSSTATLVRGTEKTLAPGGRLFDEGAGVPHWYSAYDSFTSKLLTT